jgi:DNA-binding HxlR family transcriptional regulator
MKGYGQFCPVAKASEILAERWTPLVLRELLAGSHRFNDLRRGVPLMSRSLLSKRLRSLEDARVVERRARPGRQAHEYHLTPAGEELRPLVEILGNWGQRWVLADVEEDDLDPSLLMWDIRRGVRTEHLPEDRIVVRFDLRDVAGAHGRWWLVVGGGEIDLCLTDPGFEVSLHLRVSQRTLTRYWLGQIDWSQALADDLELVGPRWLQRSIPTWLGRSAFAGVERP